MGFTTKLFYKEYSISKRNGGKRIIDEPMPDLKIVQTWILENILMKAKMTKYISKCATAFLPEKSIKDNASRHVNRNLLVCLDIHDFFGSVKIDKIYNLFIGMGYSKSVATLLSHLCTYKGCLPQGAPTSPWLSNMIFRSLDVEIGKHSRKNGIRYSRYADDLTFSGNNFDADALIDFVKERLATQKLYLNKSKTKIQNRGRAQTVTGIVVNNEMRTSKKYRKKIRQEIYYIQTFGLESHIKNTNVQLSPETYLRHLLGKVLFVLYVNNNESEFVRYKQYLYCLLDGYNQKSN